MSERNYKNYTEADIIKAVADNKSIAGCLRQLGIKPVGGNYATFKSKLSKLNCDTSHWTGPLWSKGQQLKDWSQYSRISSIRPHLIALRGNKCEDCGNTHWKDKPITLEVHHIDADRTNNDESNLQLLCPNCHSYTDSWRKGTSK